ncbi:MAG: hypothetical protein E7564_00600 [Ruminococcaceae bacterium]|nr:hypothetical protein [Oscillospiraceae bacterium]
MKKYYEIAGIGICIDIPDDKMYEDERSLSEFSVDFCADTHEFTFKTVEKFDVPKGDLITSQPSFRVYRENNAQIRYIGSVQNSWENAYIKAEHIGKKHNIELIENQFKDKIGVHTVLNCLMMEHLVAQNSGFIFHTSFIEYNNKAILFTAPSGTGKSTQADLWHKYKNAEIINGDRCAIKVMNDKIFAEGIPFAGSSQYCKKRTLEIAAVVYLQQAKETTIKRLKGLEAFRKIWEGVSVNTWDKADMASVSDVASKLVRDVPVYLLSCTPDESAVLALLKEIENK